MCVSVCKCACVLACVSVRVCTHTRDSAIVNMPSTYVLRTYVSMYAGEDIRGFKGG